MATSGAQPGNKNAAKSKVWTAAIERALAKRSRDRDIEAVDELAEKFLTVCAQGDMVALKELGDRLEGKVAQAITGADGGDLRVIFTSADSSVL